VKTNDDNEYPWLDPELPIDERVDDLVSRMTLEEKVSQMLHDSPAIERLGIPAYNWWNECLHGVARMRPTSKAGRATVFPQAIGLAASWNLDLFEKVATAISDEARAFHHDGLSMDKTGDSGQFKGLTYWSPNINIFRDPRWGRGQETYGECPYMMSRFGVTFVKALQGDDPNYLKLVSTPKHFAVHSGPEMDRHRFNAVVSAKDLWETYLPAFEACVCEAGAYSVMGAYNRTNGEPCCASPTFLQEILRDKWGFDGYVVSDCWAIIDIYKHHQLIETPGEAAAMSVKAGCDLNCGSTYPVLVSAFEKGLIKEAEIDVSIKRLMKARMKLGMFDPPEIVPYAHIPLSVVDSEEHRDLAYRMACESIVLLKNKDNLLPLGEELNAIAMIGPNADDSLVLKGNYYGDTSYSVTPLAGIQKAAPLNTRVLYAKGCEQTGESREGFLSAVDIARQADIAIVVLGLSNTIEGEEGEEGSADDPDSGPDRKHLNLPGVQEELLKEIHATGTPVILVLISGSAVALNWADENVGAILAAWYPGEEGGSAIADVIFGHYNPGGKLPVTFYKSIDQLPPFEEYSMEGRTYRFFEGEPLYPFGYGLTYTAFSYSAMEIPAEIKAGKPLDIRITVRNTGGVAGDEVVQVYIRAEEASTRVPKHQLAGFRRVHLGPLEKTTLEFSIDPYWMSVVTDDGERKVEPGRFTVFVGGTQPGYETIAKTSGLLSGRFQIKKS